MNFEKIEISNLKKGIIYLVLASLIVGSFIIFYFNLDLKKIFRIFIIGFAILLLISYIFLFNKNNKSKYIIIGLIVLELTLNCYICIKENNGKTYLSYERKTNI